VFLSVSLNVLMTSPPGRCGCLRLNITTLKLGEAKTLPGSHPLVYGMKWI
jgi:hypothetical protein